MASLPLKTFHGVAVSFGKLSAREGLRVQRLLIKAVGDAGAKLSSTSEIGLTMVFVGALGNLSEAEFWDAVNALLGTLTYGGKPFNLDTYTGGQLDLDKILAEAMKENFGDFFAAWRERMAAEKKQPGTPPTSTA